MNKAREYGKDNQGTDIEAPEGWEIVPEGEELPFEVRQAMQTDYDWLNTNDNLSWSYTLDKNNNILPQAARLFVGVVVAFARRIED